MVSVMPRLRRCPESSIARIVAELVVGAATAGATTVQVNGSEASVELAPAKSKVIASTPRVSSTMAVKVTPLPATTELPSAGSVKEIVGEYAGSQIEPASTTGVVADRMVARVIPWAPPRTVTLSKR